MVQAEVGETIYYAVRQLILAAAPERLSDLEKILSEYSPEFSLINDKPGFSLEAGPYGLVLFTSRTLHQIWLLGFAAWKSFLSYSGPLVLQISAKEFSFDWINSTPGQYEADEEVDRIMRIVKNLQSIESAAEFCWPEDIPRPEQGRPLDVQKAVTFDLVCLATAYVFLHEVRHVGLQATDSPRLDAISEELECDRFARELLFGALDRFAQEMGYPPKKVRTKRAMGVAVASFLLLVITPAELWGGSRSHPPISARIGQLTDALEFSHDDPFWIFLTCLVLTQLRSEKHDIPNIKISNAKELCISLLPFLGEAAAAHVEAYAPVNP
jgi:hypothetical protein